MNIKSISDYIDLSTLAFLTLCGIAIAGMPYPFLGSFEVGIAGAVISMGFLIIRLRGKNGWLIRQFVGGEAGESTPPLFERVWRNVKLGGIMLLMSALLGYFVSMACALPVVWWAAAPFKQSVVFDYGKYPRGRYLFDAYDLHFKGDGDKWISLTWPSAINSQVGADKPLAKGVPVTLEGRTSWPGTVIDRIVVRGKTGTVTFNADGTRSSGP